MLLSRSLLIAKNIMPTNLDGDGNTYYIRRNYL